MSTTPNEQQWQSYIQRTISDVVVILERTGYTLDTQQPHTLGERFLMQNITTLSGEKIILLGKNKLGTRVVIKAATDKAGKQELEHERTCRATLQTINFAYDSFNTPQEIAFWSEGRFTISIQAFIEQPIPFIARPLEEQFSFALAALKTQESVRATTKSHYSTIGKTLGIRTSADYLLLTQNFLHDLRLLQTPAKILKTIEAALERILLHQRRIEQYCGFLTHTDFVPHNFRISDNKMYLLDSSSLELGNKHESWARFLNFMTLYNPELEVLLLTYIQQNRAPEERESLQLMRLYRLVEIITYYTKTLTNSQSDLYTLNKTRVSFWHEALQSELQNKRVDRDVVAAYKTTRDGLRSEDEKRRQENLH